MSQTTLTIENYRCFRQVEWSPSGVCVLVGPNGSGKTTLISAFDFLRNVYLRSLSTAVYLEGGAWGLRNLSAPDDALVRLSIAVDGVVWELEPGVKGFAADGMFGERVSDGSSPLILSKGPYSDRFMFRGKEFRCGDESALKRAYGMFQDPPLSPLTEKLRGFRAYRDYRLSQLREHGSKMDRSCR